MKVDRVSTGKKGDPTSIKIQEDGSYVEIDKVTDAVAERLI